MGREPGTTRWEHAPGRTVDGTRHAEEVGIVVSHPTLTSIHLLRRRGTRLTQVANHREERLLRLRDITHEGRPVVHLGIDVDGILCIPGSIHLRIPDALQIGGLPTRLRRGNQQITAILHHQRDHIKVAGILLKGSEALVGGEGIG